MGAGVREGVLTGTPGFWFGPSDRRWCLSLKQKMKVEEEA